MTMDYPLIKSNCIDILKNIQESCKKLESMLLIQNELVNSQEKLQTGELLVESSNKATIVDNHYNEVMDDKDYISELESYLKNLNLLEPFYDCMVKKEKYGKTIRHSHICTIKVNDKSVSSSFPVECNTVDQAKQVAAKHASITLKKQYGENVIYPITNDIDTMASRIKEFLKVEYERTGLMADVLERMYRDQYQENLPDNWVPLLEVYNYFTFDKLVANDKSEIENNHNGHSGDVNGCFETTTEELNFVPGTSLSLTDYEEKSVFVSANYGSTSIWIRLVGQSADEHFLEMQAKFNATMNTTDISVAEELIEGEYYAVLYNKSWHRVQITSPKENDSNSVTCFMIDTGEQLNIDVDQICYLEPMFMKTKTQAIECMLTQLDNFGTFYGLKELLDEIILNKTFFLIPDSFEDGYARVTLYEKGDVCNRINVNDMIIDRFLQKTIAKLPSFEENTVVDGAVSSVVESGHLYLQLNFEVVSSLEEILPNDEYLLPEFFLKNKDDVSKEQVYLIKYEADNIWSRVQVIDIVNDIEAKIIYIDYGNIANCEITKLVNLDMFDPLMAKIPPQAIKVSMNLLPPSVMTSDIATKIYEIIGGDKVLVNLINAPLNDVPCIQLYKTKPDTPDLPLCINIQLAQSLKKQ